MLRFDLLEPIGDVLQRRLPIHFFPLTALLEHRLGEALLTIQGFVREAVAVGDPAFVDGFVLQRHDPHDPVALDLNNQVGARGVVGADALAPRQLPSACAVAEGLAGQRADRANVDHVAGEFGIHRVAHEGLNFRVLATVGHAKLHGTANFLPKTHAAGALDAAAHLLHRDERSDVLVEHHALFLVVARSGAAVAHGQILQLALPALIANRAIQWVIDEQELHHRLLRLQRLVGLGAHDHALRDRRGAGWHGLGGLLHIHQTHAAIGRDGQFLVVAEVRNVGARLVGRMHDHAAFGHFDLLAVDFNFNHGRFVRFRSLRPPASARRRSWPRTRGGSA